MKASIWENHSRQAAHTLESARHDSDKSVHDWACFKAQQAAELYLKGYIRATEKYVTGHSVRKLLDEIGDDLPESLKDCADALDRIYIPARYPDAYADGAPMDFFKLADSEKHIACAEKIRDFIFWVIQNEKPGT